MFKTIEATVDVDIDIDMFNDEELFDELVDRGFVFPPDCVEPEYETITDYEVSNKLMALIDAKIPYNLIESDIDAMLRKYNIIYI